MRTRALRIFSTRSIGEWVWRVICHLLVLWKYLIFRQSLFLDFRSEHNKKLQEHTLEYEGTLNTLKEHDEKYEEIAQQRIEKENKIKEEMA